MMDKSREAFEAFIADHLCHTLKFIQKNRSSTGAYYKDYIQDAWIYWQASRQALEVELNGDACHSDDYFNDGYRIATEAAEEALTSLGIRVKGNEE